MIELCIKPDVRVLYPFDNCKNDRLFNWIYKQNIQVLLIVNEHFN